MLELVASIETAEVQATVVHAMAHSCGSLVFEVDNGRVLLIKFIKLSATRLVPQMVKILDILLLLTTYCLWLRRDGSSLFFDLLAQSALQINQIVYRLLCCNIYDIALMLPLTSPLIRVYSIYQRHRIYML